MILNHTFEVKSKRLFFNQVFNSDYLVIYEGKIRVNKGFPFDGCTCAKDQPRNFLACCVHDALLYYDCNIPRKTKDLIFYDLLKENKFKLFGWIPFSPELYYFGVSMATFKAYMLGK